MPQPLLDSDQKPRPSNIQVLSPWIVLSILTLGLIWCALRGLILNATILGGLFFVVLALIITFYRPHIGARVTIGVLILGILNIITFFPGTYTISLRLLGIPIFFEVGTFILLIIHFRANRRALRPWIKDLIGREVPQEEKEAVKRTRIDGFKRNLAKKSDLELAQILEEGRLVPEALQAAQELTDERRTTDSEV